MKCRFLASWLLSLLFVFVAAANLKAESVLGITPEPVHPYHVGSVEFNYSAKSQTFQVTGRFFLDDLENALRKQTGKILYFHNEAMKPALHEALKAYFEKELRLRVEGKFLTLSFLGYQEDSEAVEVYFESQTLPKPKKVEVAVSALYNLFDDQINIVHLTVEGKRQSHKLSYPERYLYREF